MSTQELIENAVLDAMGLLDEDELAAFDRAFDSASPRVQAMVRREQARLSQLGRLLPDVDPPAGLRAAVIEAVRQAMAEELLGREAEREEQPVRSAVFKLIPSKRVTPLWRAAAIGSMAASVVLAVTMMQMSTQYDALKDAIAKNELLDQISSELGSSFAQDLVLNPRTRGVHFTPPSEESSFAGQAAVWYNPDWGSVRLFCSRMVRQDGRRYSLAIVDEQGKVVEQLLAFEASGGLDAEQVPLNLASIPDNNARLALFPVSESGQQGDIPLLVTGPGFHQML